MKKKLIIKLVIAVLAIIAIIIIIGKFFNNNGEDIHRLSNVYEQLNTSQKYLFEMERNDENKIIMAKNGDKTIIDQYSKNSHSSTITKNGSTYFVLHDREEYYVYEPQNIQQNILIDGLKEVIEKTYNTGAEFIKGKKYSYEEYAGSTVFLNSNTLNEKEENIKTRFFFDKNGNLMYIKTMTTDNQELLKINITNQVDDSIFEIPSNYAEN